jgi:hypothetical protein
MKIARKNTRYDTEAQTYQATASYDLSHSVTKNGKHGKRWAKD